MLIQVKNYKVLDIEPLFRFVLRYIYDQENMTAAEVGMMQHSIIYWKKAIDLENEKAAKIIEHNLKMPGGAVETHHKYSEHEKCLQYMGELLWQAENGDLDNRKRSFIEHGIDYRKFHRLPEAYTAEGLAKAKAEYDEYAKRNPEQELNIKPGRMI